jgi:hypothetical protein
MGHLKVIGVQKVETFPESGKAEKPTEDHTGMPGNQCS